MLPRNYHTVEQILDKNIQVCDIKKYWPNNSVSILNSVLIYVLGTFERKCFKHNYKYSIVYNPLNGMVKSWISNPVIVKNEFIHVNNDNSLCLYHFRDYSIYKRFLIGSEIIPWTIDWIYKYEEYLVNGNIWKGKEASHG
jgi:hypothetical protein